MVAIVFGGETDSRLLGELTENVLLFKNTTTNSYQEFFRWITASIKTSSVSVENNRSSFELAGLDNAWLEKIDLAKERPKQWVDNNFVVLLAKCQNSKRNYLIKYQKNIHPEHIGGMALNTLSYRLVGAYRIDKNYDELSDGSALRQKINTEELTGAPSCPCCGNQFAFAACTCGGIHCIGFQEINTCPWCDNRASYGFGAGGFDVNRTQG
jgi:hypothetical protein